MTSKERSEILENYLKSNGIDAKEIRFNDFDNSFEINTELETLGFLVLTDDEADERTKEEIESSLWAFNPDFILNYTKFYESSSACEDEEFCEAMKDLQGRLCESANAIVKALVADRFDEFVEDAIDADGRGHFLSFYDGKENEFMDMFIYRTN